MAKKEGKHNIGAGIVRALMYPFAKMPLRWHYFFAGFIAWLLRAVLHYRQDVIYTNLAKSFPDKSYAWIRKTAGDFYRHLAVLHGQAHTAKAEILFDFFKASGHISVPP